MSQLKNKKTIHTKWHSVYPIQLDQERRTRHLIHKKHDVKDGGEEGEKRVKMVDLRVVNLIAKWLQLFILQMDSYKSEECKVIKRRGRNFLVALEIQSPHRCGSNPCWKYKYGWQHPIEKTAFSISIFVATIFRISFLLPSSDSFSTTAAPQLRYNNSMGNKICSLNAIWSGTLEISNTFNYVQ